MFLWQIWQFDPVTLESRTVECPELDWNPPLSNRGLRDAQQAGRRLAQTGAKYTHIFASPAWRCQQTAQQISEALGLKFKVVASMLLVTTMSMMLQVVSGLYECLKEGNGFADRAQKRFGAGKVCLPIITTHSRLMG